MRPLDGNPRQSQSTVGSTGPRLRGAAAIRWLLRLGLVVLFAACSAGGGAPPCATSSCVPGNRCIATAQEPSQCRFPCSTHTDCPFNYHCDPNTGGTSPYCVANTVQLPQRSGQWGAPCAPTGGLANNPACDAADGFFCNGLSPLDASAYCTLACALDTDCGAGFYCGKVNKYPNVSSSQLQNGETIAACLPRGYCAPCASDVDCGVSNGAPQHCLAGTDGAKLCAPECRADSECALDAVCTSQSNFAACTPRAGVCKGDGTLCAPCRSDADCDSGGFCVVAYNATERFCSSKSGVKCAATSTGAITSQCPSTTTATSNISCSIPSLEANMPSDQCIGQVMNGTDIVPGCWTRH